MSADPERLDPQRFALAQQVADAVLYEGYVLYPYRASATKNRLRWQFGVVVPRGYAEPAEPAPADAPGPRDAPGGEPTAGSGEPWSMQTECLIERLPAAPVPRLDLRLRFLQLQARQVEEAFPAGGQSFWPVESLSVGGRLVSTWEEGREVAIDHAALDLDRLLAGELLLPFAVDGGQEVEMLAEEARLVRERWPIHGQLRLSAAEAGGPLLKLRVLIENLTPWTEGSGRRELAMRQSLLGAHTLLALRGGAFVSLLDPPPAAAGAAAACVNRHTWPVLIGAPAASADPGAAGAPGDRSVMLSSPIILYDYPAVAPESPGDLCDATEIDEILTLRVMTLTEEEKREARGTDERARQIVERSDHLPAEVLDRLHGSLRYLGSSGAAAAPLPDLGAAAATPRPPAPAGAGVPPGLAEAAAPRAPAATGEATEPAEAGLEAEWQAFLNPPGEPAPESAWVEIGGARVGRGSRLRLCPTRRADSMDAFLTGKVGRVEAVHRNVDDETWLAVTVEDDPAAELHGWFGRYFYFQPDEVEVLEAAAGAPPAAKGDSTSCAT